MDSRLEAISLSIQKVIADSNQEVLNELLITMDKAISMSVSEDATPIQLEWVLKEVTIQRYNRLGSEGLTSENIDVLSYTYIEDILSPYQKYFDLYLSSKKQSTNPSKLFRLV